MKKKVEQNITIVGTTTVEQSVKKPIVIEAPKILTETTNIPKIGDKLQSTLDFYLNVLNQRTLAGMKPAIIGLATAVCRIDWWDPKEIVEKMIEKESRGKNRREVIDYLNETNRALRPAGLSSMPFSEEKHARGVYPQKWRPKKFGK
jgi:hypothetical protein